MNTLNVYEQEQLQLIRDWRLRPPGIATRTFGSAAGPAAEAVERIVPGAVLRLALESVHAAAAALSDRRSILRRAGVDSVEQLREGSLQLSDELSQRVSVRAVALAGGSGALFGTIGTLGLIADVPSLLTITFRAIHRIGLCYGEEIADPLRRPLAVAIFALASANSMQEKQQALEAIDAAAERISNAAGNEPKWREGIERAAERELAKEAALFSLNNLGKTLAKNLGWRKAAESLPIMGALVGGSVNAWYLRDVTRVARHTFQWRWLRARHGDLREPIPLPAPVNEPAAPAAF